MDAKSFNTQVAPQLLKSNTQGKAVEETLCAYVCFCLCVFLQVLAHVVYGSVCVCVGACGRVRV